MGLASTEGNRTAPKSMRCSKPSTMNWTVSWRLCQRVILGVAGDIMSASWMPSSLASSASWSQNPPGVATIEPDLSSTSMTLGVTIGMFTTDSPQSFGSKVVLPPVGSDDMLASVGVVPAVVPSVALALAVPSVALAVSVADADAVIVIAGMEGALASVVGGLTGAPVVAVPTSVGYGAGLEGVTALLGMLASCAAGITVVGIDNGYGGACAVARMFVSPQGVRRANASAADVRQGSS